ncbi:TcpQ domain-containing protein [Niveispirillum sp. SYP-B3756]|uniref:TcpQ domain-containing protein n=1 Tax=Niveispirillum sp. SYP-B3756 TaxID=2662178 RepID=UPI00156370BC|nr:TcpQ domain-containing protein [Niveispirillum sp. SYP-B3756]
MLLALLLSSGAHAGELLWKQRPAAGGVSAKATYEQAADATTHVNGFGTSVPLVDAVAAVVPQEYKVEWAQGANRGNGQVVSWEGRGRFWTEVLADITANASLEFSIVDSRIVISAVGGHIEVEKRPALPSFEAKAGETVKATLSRWSAVAGWRLDWQASHDAIIEFGATFGADFELSVDQLFEGFSGTNPKFDPWKSDNHVLIVRTESKL